MLFRSLASRARDARQRTRIAFHRRSIVGPRPERDGCGRGGARTSRQWPRARCDDESLASHSTFELLGTHRAFASLPRPHSNGQRSANLVYRRSKPCARNAPKKRLDVALEAFNCLPVEVQIRSKLVICGSGDSGYLESMLEKVKKLSIPIMKGRLKY